MLPLNRKDQVDSYVDDKELEAGTSRRRASRRVSGVPDVFRLHIHRPPYVRARVLLYLAAGLAIYAFTTRVTWSKSAVAMSLRLFAKNRGPQWHHGIASWDDQDPLLVHPIQQLIDEGRKAYEDQAKKRLEIDTLAKAVLDYQRAFGMDPPEGFAAWYNLAVSLNSTSVPSLLPTAHNSVLPFLAMPPRLLRDRAMQSTKIMGALGLVLDPTASWEDRVSVIERDWVSQGRFWSWEAQPLVAPHLHLFPTSEPPLVIPMWGEDNSFRVPNGDIISRSVELARDGQVWLEEDLIASELAANGTYGWRQGCPSSLQVRESRSARTEFVSDGIQYADACHHPEHFSLNGELIMEERTPFRQWDPLFVPSKLHRGAEILAPPTYQMNETVDVHPWDGRHDDRLFFRGGVSGMFHSELWDWRSGQRDRLAFLGSPAHQAGRSSSVLTECNDPGCQGWTRHSYNTSDLVEQYLDVGVIQNKAMKWMCGGDGALMEMCWPNREETAGCPAPADRGCDEMKAELPWKDFVAFEDQASAHKYTLDVDGFGWTARWRRQLSTGSVVLKASIYPEWWTPQIIPWYHYVPVKYDYSDVFDIMAFFTGAPATMVGHHDDQARIIGENARDFAMTKLRWEDLQSYMFLLLLEFRRAWLDDRIGATYHPSGQEYASSP